MAPRIIVKTRTGLLSESPILIEKDNVTSLRVVSMVVEKETKIPKSLHLYYEGETLVNTATFVEKINSKNSKTSWKEIKNEFYEKKKEKQTIDKIYKNNNKNDTTTNLHDITNIFAKNLENIQNFFHLGEMMPEVSSLYESINKLN